MSISIETKYKSDNTYHNVEDTTFDRSFCAIVGFPLDKTAGKLYNIVCMYCLVGYKRNGLPFML